MRSGASCEPRNETIYTFPLFSTGVRVGYAIMLICIIAASAVMYYEQKQIPVLGIVLGCFSFFVLCYKDQWQFNCTAQRLEYTIGFIFLAGRKRYTFADIETTETEYFTKGIFKTSFMKCIICFSNGEKKTIALFPVRKTALKQQWEAVSMLFQSRKMSTDV